MNNTIMNILLEMIAIQYWIARTILVSYPDLPMRSGYETSATLQAHGTVMEELLQLNEYSVALH